MRLLVLHSYPALITGVIAGNALLAGWAVVVDMRRRALSRAFWALLLVVLVFLVVQVAAGILLAVGGARPRTPLHFLYGILIAAAAVAQFGLRPGGFLRAAVMRDAGQFREPRALALLCLTQAALIARAYMTGTVGR